MLSVKVFAPKFFYFCVWSGILMYIFFFIINKYYVEKYRS